MAIAKDADNSAIQLKATACSRGEAWEDVCKRVMIGSAFSFDWLKPDETQIVSTAT